MSKKARNEFENFDRTMHELIKVPHSEIKAALDAEKEVKKQKKLRKKKEENDK